LLILRLEMCSFEDIGSELERGRRQLNVSVRAARKAIELISDAGRRKEAVRNLEPVAVRLPG
jgi:hypothetical protein